MDDKTQAAFAETSLSSPSPSIKSPGAKDASSSHEVVMDAKKSRNILLKCDLHLIPILGFLYLVSFLDRSNIANARLGGFEKTLHMPANGFNTCLWIFYLPFVLIEIPSNLIMSWSKIKPRYWLGGMMFLLGIVSFCQGLTKSYGGLLACRFIMGALEAGLMPAAALLIAQYYTRNEFPFRFAVFLSFALAGNAFSGFLAFLIQRMSGKHGLAGWQWIFVLEGLLTICFSIIAFFTVPDFPEHAKFLDDEERTILLAKLQADRGSEETDFKTVKWLSVLSDWKIWAFTVIFFCCDIGASSIASFSPTILKQLGWTSSQAQVMSIPIWIVSIFFCLACSILSGHFKIRYPFVLFGISLSVIGWAVNLAQVNPPSVRYFGLFAIASGTFIQMPILTGWMTGNLRGRPVQAIATALQLGLGNGANFVSANVFITKEAPKYHTGFSVGLSITVIGFVACIVTVLFLARHNSQFKNEEGLESEKEEGNQKGYWYNL